jgi:hypothetical protein
VFREELESCLHALGITYFLAVRPLRRTLESENNEELKCSAYSKSLGMVR